MGGIEFLKTVRKQATSYVSVGGTPDYDYPTEFPAPTTASFEFFTY